MTNEFKRWYDYDPLLVKVIDILRDYQTELKEQAEIFLENIEKYYQMVKPINGGSRWYDKDPVISKTVELLRVVPQNVQQKVAQDFINALKENGINVE